MSAFTLSLVAVAYHLPLDPAKAKAIAVKAQVPYDLPAREFFERLFKASSKDETEEFVYMREVFELVDDKDVFLNFLAHKLPDLSDDNFELLLTEIPELIQAHRNQVLDLLIFGQPPIWNARKANINISPSELNSYFNAHYKEKNLSADKIGYIARQIKNEFITSDDKPVFDDEVLCCFRLVIFKQYKKEAFETRWAYLFNDMDDEEKMRLAIEVIDQLILEKEYSEAADFSKEIGARDRQLWAAYCMYSRCVEHGHFRDAAELTKKHDFPDSCQAALKELERMEGLEDDWKSGPNKFQMVEWAVRFGLTLRPDQVHGFVPSHTPENLLAVGCLELARKSAIRLLNSSNSYEAIKKYFMPNSPYFTDEEITQHIGLYMAKWKFNRLDVYSIFNNFRTFTSYPKEMFEKMVFQTYVQWIIDQENFSKDDIIWFMSNESKLWIKPDQDEILVAARKQILEQGAWGKYKAICKEWLPEKYVEVLKIDNYEE